MPDGRSTPDRVRAPDDELTWRFSRSSGPGGQHVNTTDTRAEVSWDLASTRALTDGQRALALERLRPRLVQGVLTVASSRYRSQHRNREAARVRLEELVAAAVVPPRPRRATRPSRASQRRRVEAKRRRSEVKASRRRPATGD
jgi:ribosome-associated protein